RIYSYEAHSNINPRGIEYYWLAAANLDHEDEKKSDITLLKQGYATITPIMLNLTAYKQMKNLKKWMKNG
ncbi:5'/3'-nucleotidase SurE, partial [Campylobacter lari]